MFSRNKNENSIKKNLYLEDRPTSKDKFQYKDIANTLEETIKQANFPTHISIMGEWGSGKSTVIKLLKDSLEQKNNSDYAMESISVWKFSDDSTSLQRKIIREIQSTLKVEDENGLDKLKEDQESFDLRGKMGALLINRFKDKYIRKTIGITIFIHIIIAVILFLLLSNWMYPILATLSINAFIVTSILIFGLNQVSKSKIRVLFKSTSKTLPLDYGDQFEKRFADIVKIFLDREKKDKLILVFDDLDRLPPNQLYSTLNTIKTFLNHENCAFIIPCDEKILRMELETAFKQQKFRNSDVSEFLNKTFDVIIKLPQVEQTNMKMFAENLLKDENIEWFLDDEIQSSFRNVLSTLIHSEIDTPRKVKKILNAFASDWYISKQRDKANGMKLLTKNPVVLAIYTVLKTNYLDFYEIIQENPMMLKNATDVEEIESLVVEKYGDTKKDIVPSQFLSKVFNRLNDDSRPYLYFSNKELNPITSIKELRDLKEIIISGEKDKFKNNLNELDDTQKTLLLDTLIPEIYSDDEYINTFNTLFSYPESLKYTLRSKDDWEYYFQQHLENIVSSIGIENTVESLYQLKASSISWTLLADYIVNNKLISELTSTWISKSYIFDMLQSLNLAEIIESNYTIINEHEEDYYYLPSIIFELPNDHTMSTNLKWDEILLKCNQYILDKNEEIKEEGNEDEEIERKLIPTELPFMLIDWINEVNSKTNSIINGEWLYSFAEVYDLSKQDKLNGLGEYWENIVSNTTDIRELEYIIKGLAGISYIEDLFDNSLWNTLNTKISNGLVSENIDKNLVKFIEHLAEYQTDNFKVVTLAMKDVPVIIQWCTDNYAFDNSELDDIKEKVILHNIESIEESTLFEKANEKILNREKDAVSSMSRLLQTSSKLFEYGENEGYFENWFNLKDNQILNISPDKDFEELLGFYWYTQSNKKEYLLGIIRYIEYILSYADLLGNVHNAHPIGNYKSSWKEHIELLFRYLLDHSEEVSWNDALTRLQNVKLYSNNSQTVSIISYLNSSTIEYAVPVISDNTIYSNQDVNNFIIPRINPKNEKHIKVLAQRWLYLNQNLKNELLNKIEQNEMYDYFIEKLLTEISLNPNLKYIDELNEENFKDSDKERIISNMIDHSNLEDVNDWLFNVFENIGDSLGLWQFTASQYMIDTIKVSPKIITDKIRDALTYKDNRTILALKVIPLIYSKTDRYKVRDILRDKILELENDNKYSELATNARNVFGWQNRNKKEVAKP